MPNINYTFTVKTNSRFKTQATTQMHTIKGGIDAPNRRDALAAIRAAIAQDEGDYYFFITDVSLEETPT